MRVCFPRLTQHEENRSFPLFLQEKSGIICAMEIGPDDAVKRMARAIWKHERDTRQHDEPFRLSWYEGSARAAYDAIHRDQLDRPSLNGRRHSPARKDT